MNADGGSVIAPDHGVQSPGGDADLVTESEIAGGVPSRYIDDATARLRVLSASFEDIQESRKRAANRGDDFSSDALQKLEEQLGRQLAKAVTAHPLGTWLTGFKGLGGPRTGRVIACVGDPRRFPGQRCTEGHTLPPLYAPGVACPVEEVPRADNSRESSDVDSGVGDEFTDTEVTRESQRRGGVGPPDTAEVCSESEQETVRCPGVMLPPRTTTGTRSLWHYAGLHVVNGGAARRRKGQQADWSPLLRTLCIGPKGLADQIVLHRTAPYRERYDEVKASKLAAELVPWRAHKIARTVAVKAFLGDLLAEWKRLAA